LAFVISVYRSTAAVAATRPQQQREASEHVRVVVQRNKDPHLTITASAASLLKKPQQIIDVSANHISK